MNYKQKYKEALEKAEIYRNHLIKTGNDTNEIEHIFPELINEDEKIRRAIYKTIKYLETELYWDLLYDISISDAYAWLEKQGETKQVTDFSDLKTWKLIVDAVLTKEHGIGQYLDSGITETYAKELLERFGNIKQRYALEKQDERQKSTNNIVEIWKAMRLEVYQQASGNRHEPNYSDETTRMFSLNDIDEIIEKISEQKDFVRKAEPKFKGGDWVVDNRCGEVRQVEFLEDDGYEFRGGGWVSYEDANKHFHIWTINDAKDGDVLYFDNLLVHGNGTLIYKADKSNHYIITKYCSVNEFGFESNSYVILNDGYIIPATKEQRDFLFQKMKEAGYAWDAEKKELIKNNV